MPTTFKVIVGLEYYALECVQPVAVRGEPVAFGEPAFVDVAGIKYWCHFDPDGYLPDEDPESITPEDLADAVEQAARVPVPVYVVGHGTLSKVELLEDGFDFEDGGGDGGPGDPPDGDDEGDDDPEDLAGVDEEIEVEQPEETGGNKEN